MTNVTFASKEVVYRADGPLDYVYFPRTRMLSSIVVMKDGASAEVAGIGREGMTGASTFLGAGRSQEQVVCQVPPCECRKMPAVEFGAEVARNDALAGDPLRLSPWSSDRGRSTDSMQLPALDR
jgi:hypothetical protein